MERLEEELRKEREMQAEREEMKMDLGVTELDMGTSERREDVERMWGKGTEGLVELGKVPSVLAKLERAGKAVEVVEGM